MQSIQIIVNIIIIVDCFGLLLSSLLLEYCLTLPIIIIIIMILLYLLWAESVIDLVALDSAHKQ
jgi:hypothetical protein